MSVVEVDVVGVSRNGGVEEAGAQQPSLHKGYVHDLLICHNCSGTTRLPHYASTCVR